MEYRQHRVQGGVVVTSRPGPRRVSVGATVGKRPFHSIFSKRLESLTYSIALERSQRLDFISDLLASAPSTKIVFFFSSKMEKWHLRDQNAMKMTIPKLSSSIIQKYTSDCALERPCWLEEISVLLELSLSRGTPRVEKGRVRGVWRHGKVSEGQVYLVLKLYAAIYFHSSYRHKR